LAIVLGKPSFKKNEKIIENSIIGLNPLPPIFGQNYGKF